MKIGSTRYPVDIFLCFCVSLLIVPIALLNLDQNLRIILGLPFILFIPGYILVFALFPAKKTDRGISILERLALSFGLSIAISPLLGLILNYTPWGIHLETILFILFGFIFIIGFVGLYRWIQTNPDERYTIILSLTVPKEQHPIDRILTVILVIAIIVAVAALVYLLITPKTGERFTEFYILGPKGIASDYPRNLTTNQNASVIIGVTNHEYQQTNYTLEIWLLNQTTVYNTSTNTSNTTMHNAWFMDTYTLTLNHTEVNTEEPWTKQWELNYTFHISRLGDFKLLFLLNTGVSNETYQPDQDYADLINQNITNAYRELHLWLHVT